MKVLSTSGLSTNPNELSNPQQGALVEAQNCVIRSPGVVEPRRGFENVVVENINEGSVRELYDYRDQLVILDSTKTLLSLEGEAVGAITTPDDEQVSQAQQANQNLYLATDDGIKKIPSLAKGVQNTGLKQPRDPEVAIGSEVAGWFQPNSIVAYRALYGYVDEHDVLYLGPPSNRVILSNKDEVYCSVDIRVELKGDLQPGYFVRIYRTASEDLDTLIDAGFVDPGDEMGLVYEKIISADDLVVGYTLITDNTPDSIRGANLYTNENSGEGILLANREPPWAKNLTQWNGRMWYGNTRREHGVNVELLGVGISSSLEGLLDFSGLQAGDIVKVGDLSFVARLPDARKYELEEPPWKYVWGGTPDWLMWWYQLFQTQWREEDLPTLGADHAFEVFYDDSPSKNVRRTVQSLADAINNTGDYQAFVVDSGDGSPPGNLRIERVGYEDRKFCMGHDSFGWRIMGTGTVGDSHYLSVRAWVYLPPDSGGSPGHMYPYMWFTGTGNAVIEATFDNDIKVIYEVTRTSDVSGGNPPGEEQVLGRWTIENPGESFSIKLDIRDSSAIYSTSLSNNMSDQDIAQALLDNSYGLTDIVVTRGAKGELLIEVISPGDLTTARLYARMRVLGDTGKVYREENAGFIAFVKEIRREGSGQISGTGTARTLFTHRAWSPESLDICSSNERRVDRVYFSKIQQPEAVPLLNHIDIGARDKAILKLVPLRDSLYVFKEDGIFTISGSSPFRVDLLDDTVRLLAPRTAIVANNQILALTNQGVVSVSDSGVRIVSGPVENDLRLYQYSPDILYSHAFAVAHDTDRLYSLWLPGLPNTDLDKPKKSPRAYVMNTLSNSWTTWELERSAGVVMDDESFYSAIIPPSEEDTPVLAKDKPTGTASDYLDHDLPVKSKLTWVLFGSPGSLNQVQEAQFHFRVQELEAYKATFETEMGQDVVEKTPNKAPTMLTDIGELKMPTYDRVTLPKNAQWGQYLRVSYSADVEEEYWALNGVTLEGRGVSGRGQR